jgi:VCBS repeat protein/ASPM-SPD-2-Hydin domain-containing protein
LGAAWAMLASAPARAQFETRGTFLAESNSRPYSVAVGDFNHDGKLDLAVASGCCPGGGVAILLGRGDGTFDQGVYYPAGDQPFSIVAADFDHDGNLDLAVANSLSDYVTILLGNGDGTFREGPQSPAVPGSAIFVTVGDFNNDGIPDLVTLEDSGYCHCVSVLLGNGDGTFQDAANTEPPFIVQAMGVGDFNRDGNLDLATAGTSGTSSSVNLLLGNGDGTFRYGASYPGKEVDPAAIAVADFNHDHKLDLAVAANFGGVSVLLGNGDGTFQGAVEYGVQDPLWVIAADLTGDRNIDLVAANDLGNSAGATVLMGKGDGTFSSGRFYSCDFETSYVAAGDFNGDRQTDLVITDYRYDNVVVLLNTGVVVFSPTSPLTFNKQAVGTSSAPQTVTLTNTGKTELKISSMKASAQFGVTSTCGSSVAAGANCTISVTFSPKTQGAKSGTVTINDSASSKPQVIELSGTGT